MKTNEFLKKLFLLIIMVYSITSFSSCKKDEPQQSKEITYDLSGDFGKTVSVKYTPTGGTLADAEETVTLPWRKVVVPNSKNASVGLIVTGQAGKPGSITTAKILVNGVEERTVVMLADANGNFVININYFF